MNENLITHLSQATPRPSPPPCPAPPLADRRAPAKGHSLSFSWWVRVVCVVCAMCAGSRHVRGVWCACVRVFFAYPSVWVRAPPPTDIPPPPLKPPSGRPTKGRFERFGGLDRGGGRPQLDPTNCRLLCGYTSWAEDRPAPRRHLGGGADGLSSGRVAMTGRGC